MSEEISLSDAALPARRRIVPLTERRVPLPVALIAHEGEDRDKLEEQISRVRPVVSFPSLAHFGAETARKERWAGIVVARTHAWDARLDTSVPRRAFIALFRLADEGYGWPDAVKRVATPEELDTWLTDLSAPVLPAEDRQRVIKPRAKRSVFTMSLAGPDPVPARTQLTLPSLHVVAKAPQGQLPLLSASDANATPAPSTSPSQTPGTRRGAAKGTSARATAPSAQERTSAKSNGSLADTKRNKVVATKPVRAAEAIAPQGLRLASDDAHEQTLINAVRALGADQARAIIDVMERFEQV